LAETLRDAGYRTAAALDNGNLSRALGFAQGFDTYEQTWLTGDTEMDRTETITAFGEHYLSADSDDERPFFLWLHYVNPHTPYDPPETHLSRFRGDGVVSRGPELPRVVGYHGGVNKKHVAVEGETHWGDYVDRYDAEILVADEHIGRVLDALERSGRKNETLVVFTSDHGESLGEHDYYFNHGLDLFNPSLRVPLIISFPGVLPTAERITGAVSSLDLYPTILDLAQVSFPASLQGKSTLPLVRATTARLHDQLFFQNDHHLTAISNGRLKLVQYPDTKDAGTRYQLFDMYTDPTETEDRYPEAASTIAPFQAELSSFLTRTVAWQQKTSVKRHAPATEDSELPAETLRNLKSLGYLNK